MNKSLKEIEIRDIYSSEKDDLLDSFYNPVLEKAILYDRITGFFSPKVLAAAARGFSNLIKSGGKIRLITSIELNAEVYKVINGTFTVNDMDNLAEWDMDDIENTLIKDYLAIFSHLLHNGQLEMRVAAVQKSGGIMHQKIGLIEDENGDALSFSGSNNETAYGWLHNIEEFKVFKNWRIASAKYYQSDREKFDRLWANNTEGVKTLTIDEAVKERLIRETKTDEDIKIVISRVTNNLDHSIIQSEKDNLRDYQLEAIKHWFDHKCTSIFEMATGTGKTRTAVGALKEFLKRNSYLHAIVVVPLTTLTIQWKNDLSRELDNCIIINTSTDSKWKDEVSGLENLAKLGKVQDYIIITTYSMLPKKSFYDELTKLGDNIILVADEMHNLATERGINAVISKIYKYRLGLSATPTRLWKQSESDEVGAIFGDNRFSFDIKRAIHEKYLVPFNYRPQKVYLSHDEFEQYIQISREIGRLIYLENDRAVDKTALNSKRIKRARIKKNAENKILALRRELIKLKRNDDLHHALIYVDNEDYLQNLQKMLTEINIKTSKLVGKTTLEDRLSIIKELRTGGIDAIVAIKCLDEGVDIPSAQTAFILSNNTDSREYVQRLGRVLRLDPKGTKTLSEVYDYIVVPPKDISYSDTQERNFARGLIKSEIIRAKFFTELALNSEEASLQVFDITDEFGFYFNEYDLCYNTRKVGSDE